MLPKVLMVDDDRSFLRLMEKELAYHAEMFLLEIAETGKAALDKLRGEDISLLVTDLRMPGVDGFELLNHVLKRFPDIPVIAMTGYDRPKTKDVVLKSGAVDYIVKPFDGEELVSRIKSLLRRKSEGGSLHNVSLETFLQLVEMEQQTCTLRVMRKSDNKLGVLFFRDGELMDARIGGKNGESAAYEVLSWPGVSLTIESACAIRTKQIDGELQAILLEAMRTKDERQDVDGELQKDESEVETADSLLLDDPVSSEMKSQTQPKKKIPADYKQASSRLTPSEDIYNKLSESLGAKGGIRDVYTDTENQYRDQVKQAERIGKIFAAGSLNMIYINVAKNGQFLVIPGNETIVGILEPDVPRDKIIGAFS